MGKMKFTSFYTLLLVLTSCNNNIKPKSSAMETNQTPAIVAEPVSYTGDSVTMNGFVAYDSALKGKLPVVMIIQIPGKAIGCIGLPRYGGRFLWKWDKWKQSG